MNIYIIVTVLPSGFTPTIKTIDTYNGSLTQAFAPMSVTITLRDDIDVSRGDMIVRSNNIPTQTQDIDVMLCWLGIGPMKPRTRYHIIHTSNEVVGMIKEIIYKVDVNSLKRNEEHKALFMNDIAKVKLRTTKPLLVDSYRENRSTGSIILIDSQTNETVAAGMIH